MSELIPQGKKSSKTSSSSSSFSSSSSSSASSSSSSKVVKQSTSSVKSSSSLQSSSSTSSSSTSSSSKSIGIKSKGDSYIDRIGSDFGIDAGKEVERLKLKMSEEMSNIHQDMFQLIAINSPEANKTVVHLDSDSLRSCIDKSNNDRLKLNFDVNEFESESINIKTVGNKIEVHAKKKSKKGDEERNEEFSRVYELPTQNAVDAGNVTSSIYKDGVLTIELPIADAIAGTDLSVGQFGHGTDLSLGQLGQTGSSSVKSACERTSTSYTTSASSKSIGIRNSGQSYLDRISSDFGIDMGKELDQLKLRMSEDLTHAHKDIFQLLPTTPDIEQSVVRLDSDSLRSCIDKAHNDRLKLNFDVNEFESESINIQTVGNKIEVHAKKKSKKGDEERNEEFSRVYELPTQNAVDAANVTSSIYNDGVLTIELPVADAIAGTELSLGQFGLGTDLSLGQLGQTGSSSVKSACERTSSSYTTSASSKSIGIKNSGQSYLDRISSDFGIDMGKELEQLKLKMSEDLTHAHKDIFQLLPTSPGIEKSVVRLDSDSLRSCIDKAHNDRLKLNFDVNEFESESINITTVGNKIEVHAKKKSKKGDEERNEEFSRVYELPTQNAVDAANVTSSIYNDGVLTIELPVADAIAGTELSLGQFGLGTGLSLGQFGHGTDLSLGQLGQTGSSSVKSACERTSSSFTSSATSKVVGIKNSGQSYLDRISSDFGIDMGKELEQLKLRMSEDMTHAHKDIFQLLPASNPDIERSVVRLDSDSLRSCIDKAHNDRLKLNFDVNEFESESINIKTVGNKIEVHAKKKSKKGDEERNEEFSRVYELPTQNAVDAGNITSSIYKDGVLTIELPVADAIAGTDFSF